MAFGLRRIDLPAPTLLIGSGDRQRQATGTYLKALVPGSSANRTNQVLGRPDLPRPGEYPKTTLCGHLKRGIQGPQNQLLATRVAEGFLGSIGPAKESPSRRIGKHYPVFKSFFFLSRVEGNSELQA